MKRIILLFVCSMISAFSVTENIKYINFQPVICVEDLLKIREDIQYVKLSDAIELHYKQSPLAEYNGSIWWEQDSIIVPERFLLSIPGGCVYSRRGCVIVDGMYIDDFIWAPTKAGRIFPLADILSLPVPEKIHSKIAVIAQPAAGNYYHWMTEVLPRLAVLQESSVAYDYIYLMLDSAFMKETIKLLGIDIAKIFHNSNNNCYMQCDELIIPSFPSPFGYTQLFAINFLRNKFIPLAKASVECDKFSKKIFISRRKTSRRKIINEDEVFALFEQYGFVRYNLEEMSVLEQVMLFYNAEMIVGEHGAGLTNIIFAQLGAQVVEIFQARYDVMYCHLSQELDLQYYPVKTIEFDKENSHRSYPTIPLDSIKSLVSQLFN